MKSGAQPGNKNAAHDKPWSAAIRKAILANDGKQLRAIADKVVAKAVEGDMQAIKEIGERLDGKAVQAIAGELDLNLTVEITKFASEAA